MKELYNLIYRNAKTIQGLLLYPIWAILKLNWIKFIGVSLLIWSVNIFEQYQKNNPKIGNTILIIWGLIVLFIASCFILNSSKNK